MLGALGYVVPAALVLAGVLILARDWRPPMRPLRTGTLCLTAALTLMLAAGDARDRPGADAQPRSSGIPAAFEARGGIVGQARVLGRLAPVLDAPAPTSSRCSGRSPA